MTYEKYGHQKRESEKRDEAERKHEHEKHDELKHEQEKHDEAEQRRHDRRHDREHEDDEPVVTHPSSEHGTPRDVEEQPTLEQRVEALEKHVDELEKPAHAPAARHDGKHDPHSLSPEQVAQVEKLIADHLQRTIGHSGEPAYGETVTEEAN